MSTFDGESKCFNGNLQLKLDNLRSRLDSRACSKCKTVSFHRRGRKRPVDVALLVPFHAARTRFFALSLFSFVRFASNVVPAQSQSRPHIAVTDCDGRRATALNCMCADRAKLSNASCMHEAYHAHIEPVHKAAMRYRLASGNVRGQFRAQKTSRANKKPYATQPVIE